MKSIDSYKLVYVKLAEPVNDLDYENKVKELLEKIRNICGILYEIKSQEEFKRKYASIHEILQKDRLIRKNDKLLIKEIGISEDPLIKKFKTNSGNWILGGSLFLFYEGRIIWAGGYKGYQNNDHDVIKFLESLYSSKCSLLNELST